MDNPPASTDPVPAPAPAATPYPAPTEAPTPAPAPAVDPNVPSAQRLSLIGGVLSYLVPGLGQIVQGRTAKGVLFLVCIYFLFFYGMYLGAAEAKIGVRTYRVPSNVYVPQVDDYVWSPPPVRNRDHRRPGRPVRLIDWIMSYPRPQILAQFWVGAVVWPAFVQQSHIESLESPTEAEIEEKWTEAELAEEPEQKKKLAAEAEALEKKQLHPVLGNFMREPTIKAINAVHNAKDKRLELAWVFTVIAGVLNIMVILDALAGPAFPTPPDEPKKEG